MTYRPDGRLATETVNAGATVTYGYDASGQLTSQTSTGHSSVWAYGTRGNRLSQVVDGMTTTYVTNPNGSVASATTGTTAIAYGYDDAGRRTSEVTKVAGTTTGQTFFTRSSSGSLRQVQRTATGQPTRTETRQHDAGGLIAYTQIDVVGQPVKSWHLAWDTATGIPQIIDIRTPGSVWLRSTLGNRRIAYQPGFASPQFFEYDSRDSVIRTDDTNTDLYDGPPTNTAWGQPTQTTDYVRYGYRGEYTTGDDTDLRNRTYDPDTGQFTTQDPMDGVDGTTTVANPYHYTDNDPLNREDPLGLRPTDITLRSCSDLLAYIFEGETVWSAVEGGGCYVTPNGFNPQCLDTSGQQFVVNGAYGILNGILLGQGSHVVDSSLVCEEDVVVSLGELVGSSLTLGLAGKTAGAGWRAITARASSSIWNLTPLARGFAAELKFFKAEQLLAKNFPRIDHWAKGVATSIKSIDLTAKSYASTSALTRKIASYIDDLAKFNGGVRGATRGGEIVSIAEGAVRGRTLILAIEPGSASLAQRAALKELEATARSRGVDFIVRTVR